MKDKNRMELKLLAACFLLFHTYSCAVLPSGVEELSASVTNESKVSSEFPDCALTPGYMNISGEVVIFGCFSRASVFSSGVARVSVKEERGADSPVKSGYIDTDGEFLLPPGNKYWLVDRVYSGSDTSGHVTFREGLLPVRTEARGPIGYRNTSGSLVIEPQFSMAYGFSEGLAGACISEGQCGYIDKSGEFVIPPTFQYVRAFQNGIAVIVLPGPEDLEFTDPVEDYTHLYGLINRFGEYLVPPNIHKVHALENFYHPWGYASEHFLDLPFSSEGLLPVRVTYSEDEASMISSSDPSDGLDNSLGYGKWGYVSNTGGYAIAPSFGKAGSFYEGKANVEILENAQNYPADIRGKAVQIDLNGRVTKVYKESETSNALYFPSEQYRYSDRIISILSSNPDLELITDFSHGLAVASRKSRDISSKKKKVGFVDTQGRFVISPTFKTALPFSRFGLAVVAVTDHETTAEEKKWGLINRAGEYVIEPQAKYGIEIFEEQGLIGVGLGFSSVDSRLSGTAVWLRPESLEFLPYTSAVSNIKNLTEEKLIPVAGKVPDNLYSEIVINLDSRSD